MEEVPEGPPPRLCHLVKWPDFDGYGFNLHAEKSKPGQFIGKVDDDSPALLAGLREGDKIVEVNSVNISNENHRQVVERIKAMPNETRLLVVDPEADRWYKEHKVVARSTQSNVIYAKTPPHRPGSTHVSEADDEITRLPVAATNGHKYEDEDDVRETDPPVPAKEINLNGDLHEVKQNGGPTSLTLSDTALTEPLGRVSLDPQNGRSNGTPSPSPVVVHHNGERVHVVELERAPSSSSAHGHDSPRSSKSMSSSGRGSSSGMVSHMNGGNNNSLIVTTTPKPPVTPCNSRNGGGLTRSDSNSATSDAGSSKSGSNHSSFDMAHLRQNAETMQVEEILNLNLTASQVRELIASRKRRDPRKEPMDLRQKYDIIQQL